jgi:hypothetical protein
MSIIHLSAEEINNLSSDYISEGIKIERWSIKSMSISNEGAHLVLMINQASISDSDPNGFHLSFLTAMEMLAQMMVIYLHKKAGLTTKCREIWVSSINSDFKKPIRAKDNILIDMVQIKLQTKGSSLVCDVDCKISDSLGGHFQSKGRVWLV